MSRVTSFSPIADKSARVLVLGSMPGLLSLQANQYYAHPRNAFWRIMSSIYGFSAIEAGSRIPNDFPAFFEQYPGIKLVGFNGGEAEKSFRRYALPHLNASDITFVRLPSTSPAHAVSFERKVAAWRLALAG